jgi:hypothetical protein
MDNIIDITPESFDYNPSCDRPEPEHFDIQISENDHESVFQNSLEDLIELNTRAGAERLFRLDHTRRNLKFFTPRPRKERIPLAS